MPLAQITLLRRVCARAGMRGVVGALLVLVALGGNVAAQGCPHTPAVGSPERKAIMDTLRQPIEAILKQPVVFVADAFAVCGDWAFLEVTPQRPNDQKIDWSRTPFADTVAEGICGGYIHALLFKLSGRWYVREQVICANDVPWVGWAEQYDAPKEIFPKLQ